VIAQILGKTSSIGDTAASELLGATPERMLREIGEPLEALAQRRDGSRPGQFFVRSATSPRNIAGEAPPVRAIVDLSRSMR
jgi:hypothetical protein